MDLIFCLSPWQRASEGNLKTTGVLNKSKTTIARLS